MARIQGLTESLVYTGSAVVKTEEGELFDFIIAWRGATVGDRMIVRDSTAADSGTPLFTYVVATANGTDQLRWANGKRFETGLAIDKESIGTLEVSLTYK